MSRRRVALGIAAVIALGIAAFVVVGERPERTRGRGARGSRARVAGSPEDPRALGVGARESDLSASARVSGRVEDADGIAVTDGRLILHCLRDGASQSAPIPHGTLELGPEGEFEGYGCRGLICAELSHTAMIQGDSWVLAPGKPAVLVARPLGRREGIVVDADGEPVAGARLVIRPLPEERDPTALPPFTSRTALSDGDGLFTFARVERPPCDPCAEASGRCSVGDEREVPTYVTMLLIARAPGFRDSETTVEIEGQEPWRVVMEAPAEPLRGRLVDDSGAVYPRARILARSQGRAHEIHQAPVIDGRFELGELGEGPYDLRAIQDGIELATQSGAAAGDEVELRGGLPAVGVALTLVVTASDDDRPLADVAIDGGPFTAARTDAAGEVSAAEVLAGTYSLLLRAPGLEPQRRSVVVSEGEPSLTVEVEILAPPPRL